MSVLTFDTSCPFWSWGWYLMPVVIVGLIPHALLALELIPYTHFEPEADASCLHVLIVALIPKADTLYPFWPWGWYLMPVVSVGLIPHARFEPGADTACPFWQNWLFVVFFVIILSPKMSGCSTEGHRAWFSPNVPQAMCNSWLRQRAQELYVWKSRWPPWASRPRVCMVSVDVKQHWTRTREHGIQSSGAV